MAIQMRDLDLSFTVVEAIDGSTISECEKENIQKNRNATLYKNTFTVGEMGCALSHMAVYKKIIDEHIKESFIIEDDILLYPSFKTVVQQRIMQEMPKDWDVIFCGYVQHGNIYCSPYKSAHVLFWKRKKLNKQLSVGVPVEFCYHTAGYMVSYKGAKKLYTHGIPIRMPADILTGNAHNFGLSVYALSPPCVRQYIWKVPESTVKNTTEIFSYKQRCINVVFSSHKKELYLFFHIIKVYFLCKNMFINAAKGYFFPVRFLRKLGIISLDRKKEN